CLPPSVPHAPRPPLLPSTPLFRSDAEDFRAGVVLERIHEQDRARVLEVWTRAVREAGEFDLAYRVVLPDGRERMLRWRSAPVRGDRESTRLNSSHVKISYAVFCLK